MCIRDRANPIPPPRDAGASPGLAFLLGLIPGVGAIYNGQYVKGLMHVVILGILISIVSSGSAGGMEPLFGMKMCIRDRNQGGLDARGDVQQRRDREAGDESIGHQRADAQDRIVPYGDRDAGNGVQENDG